MPLSKYSNCKKRTIGSEHRVFQERWKLAYFCCESRGKITCLMCSQSISVAEEYNLRRHYETHHHKYDQYQDKSGEDKVRDLETALGKQQPVFKNSKGGGEASLRASYAIAELVTNKSKYYSVSAFVKQCLLITAEIVCPENFQNVINISCREIQLPRELMISHKRNRFVARLLAKQKEVSPESKLHHIRCITHQEVLCSNTVQMEHVLKYVKKVVNFIRSRGLNQCQFSGSLKTVGSEFDGFPYHAEVHWLSCFNVLKRFWLLREEIRLYLEMKCEYVDQLCDDNWLQDLAFMLQAKDQLVISMYCHIKAFKLKINLWEGQLNGGNIVHFPTCQDFRKSHSASDFSQYTFNVNELINEFESMFEDFKTFGNDFSLFSDPVSFDVQKADSNVQMELIDIQCNTIPKYYSYLPSQCSEMRKFAAGILAMFGSTYLCVQFFSLMKANKTSHRSRLTTKHLSSILKIASSQNLVADIETLVSKKKVVKSQ
ncbi:hypothetical protein PR048_014300, partial [Dryococelus australis]